MFQIPEFTEARITSITNRVEKHGDDEKPAVSLALEIEAANTILDLIDPKIREALFKRVDDHDQLPGVEESTPVLRCNSIDRVTLPTKHEGWTLAVDNELDESKPMKFGGVKADKFSVEPKQGGSIVLRLRVGTSDVDAQRLGWLGMHNGEAIWITLTPPEPKPEAIDGTTGHPGASGPSAEDLFAAGGETDPGADETNPAESGTDGASSETPAADSGTKPRRGRQAPAEVE